MAGVGDEVYYTTGYTWDKQHVLYKVTAAGVPAIWSRRSVSPASCA